ncbi:TRM11 family SAM-dependent methyltransferase [Aureibacter tunicatorum]|uniref:tRNA G10 N-methylase Trm11 n=1 Tax=Aureibacter tunicatorum TaxID=866807 RepID=A0AAE3XSN1_9BACT|nr:hypothetical protein [Aureibacter tunicatorum]MDR6241156.1 tRNA G10 N-methylase Trm11 [Aureibacter tunicatorum]BDD03933.1 methyltransferase [Aureibacter tunicatorum]
MHKHIYSFNYPHNENDLCKFESRHLFHQEEKDKMLFSDIKIEPSSSAFIKKRIDVLLANPDYDKLIESIKEEKIRIEGFKLEYLQLEHDPTEYKDRLNKLRDIGHCIEGEPDYYNPTKLYALCWHEGLWYFGSLIKDDFDWHKHKQKPRSFSNSISMTIAKTLVNVASQGNKDKKLIDACCGVGTVVLEACFAGYDIEGCDINWKTCWHSRENLEHFGYSAEIHRSDIKDLDKIYDAGIIDLPYNLYAYSDDDITANIIESTAKITQRVVIVSTTDIESFIKNAGLKIVDTCSIKKIGKTDFTREIWVCEKSGS